MNFTKFNTFVFDLDGTIWNWKKLYPGVKERIERLQKLGKQIIFVTNNSLFSTSNLLKKINKFGINVSRDCLITAGFSLTQYLLGKEGRVLAFGRGVTDDLRKVGIELTNYSDCNYLVIGYDPTFNLEKLALANEAIQRGAKFIATTKAEKWVYGEKTLPGTGVIVELAEKFCGKKAKILGKPSDFFAKLLWSRITSLYRNTVMFGDSCSEDIATGRKLGFYTVLVLTGVDKKVEKVKPNLVINSIADIKI